tara:strand:+ start:417 stop:1880 length:1464 start_codon:yes stop_codon:yes gene_type:complete
MINKITIVGGGTAGLISALILKTRFADKEIEVIKSDKIGIIGVGEGTTEHWSNFMNYVGINQKELIKECNATFKYGVMFEGWTDKPYFHNINGILHNNRFGQYLAGFGSLISKNKEQIESTEQLYKNNEMFFGELNENTLAINQYHFDTFKLNEFLLKKCREKDINIIDDVITDINLDNHGNIFSLVGGKNNIKPYKSDFYIDCTGFKRQLITKMGAKWENYNDYLKLNHAIAFQTEDTENYNVYTLSKAMKYGWMWRIPVWGRWGNGYIFDDTLINAEQAKKEVEEVIGKEIKVARDIKFEAGALDKPWIGNCLAVGLCANFIEPLEATSIGTSINQMFMLMHHLENYEQTDIDDYNKKMNSVMKNIRDFVFVHYMVKRKDTDFWKKIAELEPPKTLKENLKRWKTRLPIKDDFNDTEYHLFFEQNWASVLWGLELFDKDKIKKEYNSYSTNFKNFVENDIKNWENHYENVKINHKEFLEIYRKAN